ncbi:MAG: 50S ribosomal protein L25, partial [Chloroflexota bacterium]|nr:50S ribosomal protein L25 [Chloroflexota bacterium]
MEDLTLSVDKRVVTGKKVSLLRREGITPLHLYGNGIDSQSLQCNTALISKVINEAGTNIPVNL